MVLMGAKSLALSCVGLAAISHFGVSEIVLFLSSYGVALAEIAQQHYLFTTVVSLLCMALWWRSQGPRPVLLRDFVVFQPDDSLKVHHLLYVTETHNVQCNRDRFLAGSRAVGCFTQEELEFMEKILRSNGLGDDTYFPPGLVLVLVP